MALKTVKESVYGVGMQQNKYGLHRNTYGLRRNKYKPGLVNKKRLYAAAYMFLAPALALYAVFWIYPLVNTIKLSFYDYNIIAPARFIGLDNWVEVFSDPNVLNSMLVTFKYTLVVVPSLVVFPLVLAILLDRKIKAIGFFKWAYYLPYILPLVILSVAWKLIYNSNGILNSILSYMGLEALKQNWLSQPETALFSVAFVTISHAAGYYMIIYLTGLGNITDDIKDAARIDGASALSYYLKIAVPLVRQQILLVAVISTIGSLKGFDEIYLLTGGGPAGSTSVLSYYIYKTAFSFFKMGYACTISVIFLVITILLSLAYVKILGNRQ